MSASNRIEQLSQIRETTLEAAATNAETGITYHGAAAVYRLQSRHSASNRGGSNEQVHFDLGDPKEVEKLRVSVSRRRTATMPNRMLPEWDPSRLSTKDESSGHTNEEASNSVAPEKASIPAAEEVPPPPFPTKKVLCIIITQLLSAAPSIMFAAVAPYMYASLIGDFQTAGTVSSVATGISMVLQMLFTPIAAQIMDLYGRKKLAIFNAMKAVVVIAPLLVAGIVISTGSVPEGANATDAKLGAYLADGSKRFVQVLWLLNLLSSATSTSQAVVAIGDVCQTQRARSTAIGMYAGCMYTLAAFAVVGAKVSVLVCGCVALVIALAATVCSLKVMPETRDVKIEGHAERVMQNEAPRNDAAVIEVPNAETSVTSSRNRRLSFYPSQRELSSLTERLAPARRSTSPASNSPSNSETSPYNPISHRVEYNASRRITIFVNPFAGFSLLKKSRSSYVALWVLFSCLMAEISASDTLVYYLSITLDFGPSEVSYLQIEQALLSIVFCGVVGPFLTKFFSCSQISMVCSVSIVTALLVLALAKSSIYIYAIYSPCISMASVQMPSLAAIITKHATTPEDVSLAMSTVMAVVAVLTASGSFLAALVFRALPEDKLYVTFIISALFTVPMFVLSVYLGYVTKKEEAEEKLEGKVAAEENGTASLSH